MVVFLGVLFLMSNQPLMMVVSLILITLFYSLYMFMYLGSFWYSYGLIMIMLSGMFILFMYMASLIPNEEFEVYMLSYIIIVLYFLKMKMDFIYGFMNYEYVSLNMWSSYVSGFLMFLGLFLLMIMLMVIWLSCKNKGSLRVF